MSKLHLSPFGPHLIHSFITAITGFSIFFHQPLYAQAARSIKQKANATTPILLPTANPKIRAVVYPFRIATDQQSLPKNSMQALAATHYSTILFDVLRNSGWFEPAEHGNAGTFMNRQQEKSSPKATEIDNPPVSEQSTFILEAGLFSHDATMRFDEAGNKYFTGAGSKQYRQDQATVFLRALSAQSGKILKTIYWTKTVLSQPLADNTYRYVLINQPNENSIGVTATPTDQLAITEAIKQAVRGLVIEGIRDGLWSTGDISAVQLRSLISTYEKEREQPDNAEQTDSYALRQRLSRLRIAPSFINVCLYGGAVRYHGDYTNWETKFTYGLSVEAFATPYVGIQLNAAAGTLASRNAFSTNITALEANLIVRVLPYWRLTPLIYGGVGMVSQNTKNPFVFEGNRYLQYQGGVGLQYSLNEVIGIRTLLSYNLPGTDQLDGKQAGDYNDFYVRTTLGLVIHFGHYKAESK